MLVQSPPYGVCSSSIFSAHLIKEFQAVQQKSKKQTYPVTLIYSGGGEKTIMVKATSPEQAEKRALKFNPSAVGVK